MRGTRFVSRGAWLVVPAFVVAGLADGTPSDNPLLLSTMTFTGLGDTDVEVARIAPDGMLWTAGVEITTTRRKFPTSDIVVRRIDPATSQVLSTARIGGAGTQSAQAIAFDAAGNAYVAGWTNAPEFPFTGGIFAATRGREAAFAARVAPDGNSFAWAFGIDGSNSEYGTSLCISPEGDPVLASMSASAGLSSQFQIGPLSDEARFRHDLVVTRIRADGSGHVFSTRIGGTRSEYDPRIATTADGYLVAAHTDRGGTDFPVTGQIDGTNVDALTLGLLFELDASGASIRRGGWLGNAAVESVVVRPEAIYVGESVRDTHLPAPTGLDFDVTRDAKILRLDPATLAVTASMVYGGSATEVHLDLDAAGDGTLWLSGVSYSQDLAVPGAIRPQVLNGDPFVAAFDPTTLELTFGSYLGGQNRRRTSSSHGAAVAAAPDGTAWFVETVAWDDHPGLFDWDGVIEDPAERYDLVVTHVAKGSAAGRPTEPFGLATETLGPTSVKLTWSDGAGAAAVAVDRQDDGKITRVGVVPAGAQVFVDDSAVAARTRLYSVQAVNDRGGSPHSTRAFADTPPSLGLALTAGEVRRVRVARTGVSGRLRGVIARLDGALPPLDLVARGIDIDSVIEGASGPLELHVIPGHPSWRVGRTLRWSDATSRFKYDPVTGRFDLVTTRRAPEAAEGLVTTFRVTVGQDSGTGDAAWHRTNATTWRTE